MTEQLLSQQLESPSGTGRVEPRSQISLPARTTNKRGCKPAHAFSLAVMRAWLAADRSSASAAALMLARVAFAPLSIVSKRPS